jgi:DNA-binding MarR family transcriptional regulator
MSIGLPNSAILVLSSLASEGPMTPKTIIEKVALAPRTISFALRTLVKEEVIRKIPNLTDMRQPIYHIDMERYKEILLRFDSGQISQVPSSFRPSGLSFNS